MADSKVHKKVTKNQQSSSAPRKTFLGKSNASKHGLNTVHKTTSECLRLEALAGGGGTSNTSLTGSDNLHQTTIGSMSEKMHHPHFSSSSSSSLASSASTFAGSTAGTSSVSMLSSAAQAAAAAAKQQQQRDKPKTSFQITSVITKGNPTRISADNGDDSADDLDESHAEDSSHIDTETPSFSEDTFSKEDVFFTASDGIGIAPVIPTSSQYGLAIVAPNLAGGQNLADVHVSVTDAGINLMTNSKKDDLKDMHHRNERFKVVKIESTEPFRRGRWICMDYLDHSTLQPTVEEAASSGGGGGGETEQGLESNASGVDTTTATTTTMTTTGNEKGEETDEHRGGQQQQEEGATGGIAAVETVAVNESPGQTQPQPLANEIQLSSSSNSSGSSNNPSNRNQASQAQTMAHIPIHHQSQSQATSATITSNAGVIGGGNNTNAPQHQQQTQGQSHPAQYYSQVMTGAGNVGIGGNVEFMTHGATLPTNLLHGIVASQNTQNSSNTSSPLSAAAPNVLPPAMAQQLSVNVDASSSPLQDNSAYSSPSSSQQATTISPSDVTPAHQIINPGTNCSQINASVITQAASNLPNGPIAGIMDTNPNAFSAAANQQPTMSSSSTSNLTSATATTTSNETCDPPAITAGSVTAMEPPLNPLQPVQPLQCESVSGGVVVAASSLMTTDSSAAGSSAVIGNIVGGSVDPTTVSPVAPSNGGGGNGQNSNASSVAPATSSSANSASASGSASLMSPSLGQSLPQQQQQLLQNIVAEDGQSNEDSER